MARETRDVALACGLQPIFFARGPVERAAMVGEGEVVLEDDIHRFADLHFVIGIGLPATRKCIAERYRGRLRFASLIHPSATFGLGQRSTVEGTCGTIVCAGVRFTSNITVGSFTIFNANSTVHHDSVIGDYVTVSPMACILGNIVVEACAWVGAGSVINEGSPDRPRVIGEGAVIGSGSVVLHDCAANGVYVGVPAIRKK